MIFEYRLFSKVSENNFVGRLLDQDNYVECLSIDDNAAKSFDILATSLSVSHNYFDSLTKLFSDLYLV